MIGATRENTVLSQTAIQYEQSTYSIRGRINSNPIDDNETSGAGFSFFQRLNSNDLRAFKSGILVDSFTWPSVSIDQSLVLMAAKIDGGSIVNHMDGQLSFVGGGSSLEGKELALYEIIQ